VICVSASPSVRPTRPASISPTCSTAEADTPTRTCACASITTPSCGGPGMGAQHEHEALRRLRGVAERELDQRWARNTMLNKWLEYCIDRATGFAPSRRRPRPRPRRGL
jgi:hypothetical protein